MNGSVFSGSILRRSMRYLLIVLMLAGCSSLEKIAQEEPVEQRPAQDARKIAAAKRICMKQYGYLPGSSTYERCMEENAPGLEAEIEKNMKKEAVIADAKLKCKQQGYLKDTEEFYSCVNDAVENASRASVSAKKQRR